MSQSSPSVLSLLKVGTRSLRQATIARAEPAGAGAGFASTLDRLGGRPTDGPAATPDTRQIRTDRERAEDREAKAALADESEDRERAEREVADAGADDRAHAGSAAHVNSAGSPSTEAAVESRGPALPDHAQVARARATTGVAEQAKTGPVTAQILTELALQGQAVGRFALVSPKFKPGAVTQGLADQAARPASVPASPNTDQPRSAAAERPPSAPVQPSIQPSPSPISTTTPVHAAVTASIDPAGRAATPKADALSDSSPRAAGRAADAPSAQPQGQARQDNSSRQDQPGRQSEASLRGLDAMLNRPAAKARASAGTADPAATRALSAQLERGVSAALNSRDGVVTLRLSPEQLGPLKVRVSVEKGAVTAAFEASSPQARKAVEQSIGTLKDALAAKGLVVDRIEVTLAQPLPQRELGLPSPTPPSVEQPGVGLANTSVGDQGSSRGGQQGASDDRSYTGRSPDDTDLAAQSPLDLSSFEQAGFRYITTPDGRLGVVALA